MRRHPYCPQNLHRKKRRAKSPLLLLRLVLLTQARLLLQRVCPKKATLKRRPQPKHLYSQTSPLSPSQHLWMMNLKPGSRCIQSLKVIP
jgi:hypothetical protein